MQMSVNTPLYTQHRINTKSTFFNKRKKLRGHKEEDILAIYINWCLDNRP